LVYKQMLYKNPCLSSCLVTRIQNKAISTLNLASSIRRRARGHVARILTSTQRRILSATGMCSTAIFACTPSFIRMRKHSNIPYSVRLGTFDNHFVFACSVATWNDKNRMLKFVLPVSHTQHWHMVSVHLTFFTDFRAACETINIQKLFEAMYYVAGFITR